MSVPGPTFVVELLCLTALIFFLPRGFPRQLLLAICNAGFLALSVPNWLSWISLFGFVISAYLTAIVLLRTSDPRAKSRILKSYVISILIVFVVLKEYRFLAFVIPPGVISKYVTIVGISYMLFRQIHYVVDVAEGQIQSLSLWNYLNYQFDLFALYAGPIQRFEQFEECWATLAPTLPDFHEQIKAFFRLMVGIIKVNYVAVIALHLSQIGSDHQIYLLSRDGIIRFALLFYAYPAYIYFNFSGYCDVVIAGASLVGIQLPENFNRPYLARNAIDFWTRWHMSLTNWIRDYVFTPLYKKGTEASIMRPQPWSYVCFFIALFLAGVWHGSTWNFVVFGTLHGCGVAAAKMWEGFLLRRKGRPGLKAYLKSMPIRIFMTLLTFNFVCATLLFFPTDLSGRLHFLWHFLRG